jgi:hypothetical protein
VPRGSNGEMLGKIATGVRATVCPDKNHNIPAPRILWAAAQRNMGGARSAPYLTTAAS